MRRPHGNRLPRGHAAPLRPRLRRRRQAQEDRNGMDGDGAHHHGGDRFWRAVAGVGDGAAWVGDRGGDPGAVRGHHLVHVRPPRRLLPPRGPRLRQAQLHLHGGGQGQPRRLVRLVLRLLSVRQHVRHLHRLHHHRLHQRGGHQQVQLLPLARPRRGLQPEHEPVHHRLRRGAGHLLPAAQLPQALVAVHHRGRHVLHLLLHRGGALPGADHLRPDGEDDADRHAGGRGRGLLAEDMDDVPGAGQRGVRLLVRHHPHRDPGHASPPAGGVQDDAARHGDGHLDDHGLLHAVRVPGVRGVRERRAREHPDRVRILRTLLARGPRQRLHRRAPRRRLPGVLPAAVRRRRGRPGGDVPHGRAPDHRRRRRRERVPDGVAHGVRGGHHAGRHPHALLQQHPRHPREHRLLAAHRLLPRRDVHPAAPGAAVQHQVGGATEPQLRMLPRHRRLLRRVRAGRARLAQDVRALQDQVVITSAIT